MSSRLHGALEVCRTGEDGEEFEPSCYVRRQLMNFHADSQLQSTASEHATGAQREAQARERLGELRGRSPLVKSKRPVARRASNASASTRPDRSAKRKRESVSGSRGGGARWCKSKRPVARRASNASASTRRSAARRASERACKGVRGTKSPG